jgi:hypothetical protein
MICIQNSLSGSKKSAPIRMAKEACEEVEALDGIPVKRSSLNASANMESLCCELEQQPCLLQVSYSICLTVTMTKTKTFFSYGMNSQCFLAFLALLELIELPMIEV